nr:hypothetical protein [Bradyrhizobium nitroreducens]
MPDGAVLAGLDLVLEDHLERGAIVLEAIGRADQADHLVALDHAGARIGREGADRSQVLNIHRQNPALGVERHAGTDAVVAGVDVRDEGLHAVGNVFHGATEQDREADHRHVFVIDMQLHPEGAADIGGDDADTRFRDVVVPRIEILELIRRLRTMMHGKHAGRRIVIGDDRTRLQRHRGVAAEAKLLLHHMGRMRKGLVDGAAVKLAAEAGVIGAVGIDQRRAGLSRAIDIDDRRKISVIDLDQLQCILGDRPALGDDCHHRLPGPDHAIQRQRPLRRGGHALEMVERPCPRCADFCKIRSRGDEMHAFDRAYPLGVDRNDLRMRMRAAQERGVEHARQLEVADIAPATGQQPLGVRARHGAADIGIRAIERGQRRAHAAPPPLLRAFATASMASTMVS